MGDISTKDYNTKKIPIKNSNTGKTVEGVLDRVARDGKTITVILANQKVIFNKLPNRPGLWVSNQLGMELIATYSH